MFFVAGIFYFSCLTIVFVGGHWTHTHTVERTLKKHLKNSILMLDNGVNGGVD